jgi:hypothetical protein
MFLHADLLHLGLNSVALIYLIPIAARTIGVHRTVCLYFASGLCAAAASTWMGKSGLGASGALCGLIAAAAVYGWRRGGTFGRELSRAMVSWGVMILVLGLVVRRVDHAGHIGGFAGGAALGWLAAAARARGGFADRAWAAGARLSVVAALLVAAVFWAPFVVRNFERHDVELYRSHADRTLRNVQDALGGAADARLPETFPDGPGGSEGVRDAVRRALTLARAGDPGAREGLAGAFAALGEWSQGLWCRYGIQEPE